MSHSNSRNGGTISFEGVAPEVVNMEVLAGVPTVPRSPRLKPTPTREVLNTKKDKKKKSMLVRESLRKHAATQA